MSTLGPVVSIIVPLHEVESYVARCIQSLSLQDSEIPFEVVFVCSGCKADLLTDQLARSARLGCDVKIVFLQRNLGPGIARNAGIDASSGDWIIFLDSDDYLHPDALATLLSATQECQEVDGVAFGFTRQQQSQAPDPVSEHWTRDSVERSLHRLDNQRRDLKRVVASPETVIRHMARMELDGSVIFTAMRASLLKSVGLRFSSGFYEDIDFMTSFLLASRGIMGIPDVCYVKVERSTSITSTFSSDHVIDYLRAWRRSADLIAESRFHPKFVNPQDIAFGLRGAIGVIGTLVERHAADSEKSEYLALAARLADAVLEPYAFMSAPAVTEYDLLANFVMSHR